MAEGPAGDRRRAVTPTSIRACRPAGSFAKVINHATTTQGNVSRLERPDYRTSAHLKPGMWAEGEITLAYADVPIKTHTKW